MSSLKKGIINQLLFCVLVGAVTYLFTQSGQIAVGVGLLALLCFGGFYVYIIFKYHKDNRAGKAQHAFKKLGQEYLADLGLQYDTENRLFYGYINDYHVIFHQGFTEKFRPYYYLRAGVMPDNASLVAAAQFFGKYEVQQIGRMATEFAIKIPHSKIVPKREVVAKALEELITDLESQGLTPTPKE